MSQESENPINVLFDQWKCLVVNKPGGVLTQAPPGIDSMELRVKRLFKSYQPEGSHKKIYVGVPHRLDRPVSGVMMFCKNKTTTQEISAQFQKRAVGKIYWAVVEETMPGENGTLIDSMRKIPGEAKSEIVSSDHEDAQHAELDFQVLGTSQGKSWLRIQLKTGRTHQIRLQLSSRGNKILGDQLYDSPVDFGPETSDLRARWISLHARRLDFTVPENKQKIEVTAPLPVWWSPLAEEFPEMKNLEF